MSLTLNQVTTEAEYPSGQPQGGTILPHLRCGAPCAIAEIDVSSHPVFVRMGVSPTGDTGQATYAPELFLPVGHRTIVRKYLFSVSFRDAVAGEHGIVTVELIPVDEVWLEFLAQGGGVYK